MSNCSETKENAISFVKDIQLMMFGLGDSSTPLQSTAAILEKIVLQQLLLIVTFAEEIAEKRGVDGIYPQDILFLMRKDVHRLRRIINYVAFKEEKTAVLNSTDEDKPELSAGYGQPIANGSKRRVLCELFLKSIGVKLNEPSGEDEERAERLRRCDLRTQNMSIRQFSDFNQSRQTAFVSSRLGNTRFIEWMRQNCPENTPAVHKLKMFTVDMLAYLAKETVAQLIDLALLLRRDRQVCPTNPLSRANNLVNRQIEGPLPLTPEEVGEVLRRFYSTQLCPWGAFTCTPSPTVFQRVLALS